MMKATEANAIATAYARIHATELANETDALIREKAGVGKFYTYYSHTDFMNVNIRRAYQELIENNGYTVRYIPDLKNTFEINWEKKD